MSQPAGRGATSDEHGPLPPGWKTKVDPKKNRRFYYNRERDVTSWHRPQFEVCILPLPPSLPLLLLSLCLSCMYRQDGMAQPAPQPAPQRPVGGDDAGFRDTHAGGALDGRKMVVTTVGKLAKRVGTKVVEIQVSEKETVTEIMRAVQLKLGEQGVDGELVAIDTQRILLDERGQNHLEQRTKVKEILGKHREAGRELLREDTLASLKNKLRECGAKEHQIQNVDDANDPKKAAVELYLNLEIDRGIDLFVDIEESGCLCAVGTGGSSLEWTCVCIFASCGIFFISALLAIGAAVFYAPEEVGRIQHYLFVGSFFGVIGSCSMVCFIALLLPRYTEKRGVWWDQDKLNKLKRETWIWSFALNGQGAKVKVLIALWLAGVKFAQLFTLTYDPAAISEMPDWAIEIGEYTLLDFETLLQDKNSSANAALSDLDDLAAANNLTAAAAQALADGLEKFSGLVTGEDAYKNYFIFYSGVCVGVLILVCLCWSCLNGRGSESMERKATFIVGSIQGFVAIPIYTHLLAGLDCTYSETGFGPYLNESGFYWDGATDAFGFQSDAQLRATVLSDQTVERDHQLISDEQAKSSCYGRWSSPGDIDEWTAFNYMIFGMIAICIFHWPVSLFLMAKNDSERDDNEAVTLIVDAIIRAKQLEGRKITSTSGANQYFAPGGGASDTPVDNFDNVYEAKKKCCKARARKPEYARSRVEYAAKSNAAFEFEKLWSVDPDSKKKYEAKRKKFERKNNGRQPTREQLPPPEKVPAMNRVEIRKYALQAGVTQEEVDAIDHRHKYFWQVRDLDSAEDGVKGPKKRPREAAVNFGFEVAIVVISALFSGDGLISDMYVGQYCTWPTKDHAFSGFLSQRCGELTSEQHCVSEAGRMIDEPEADVCVWASRPLTVMETKLGCLAVLHLLMAIYFWCALTLAGKFRYCNSPCLPHAGALDGPYACACLLAAIRSPFSAVKCAALPTATRSRRTQGLPSAKWATHTTSSRSTLSVPL